MDDLSIKETKDTPEIRFNFGSGELLIAGESYPEDAFSLYGKVFDWLNEYIKHNKPITFNFRLIYFNTSSSKCILDILDILNDYFISQKGCVTVNWFYNREDSDILENGEEFAEDLDIPFHFIAF